MKRFTIAAVLAAIVGLGTASTADAQYIVQYNRVTPYGGVATNRQVYNLGVYQSYNTYVSPFGTVGQSMYYGDVYGNRFGHSTGYNPYTGFGYNRGFVQPNPYFNPYFNPSARGIYFNFYGR